MTESHVRKVAIIGPRLGQRTNCRLTICLGTIIDELVRLRVNGVVLTCGFGNKSNGGVIKSVNLPYGLFVIKSVLSGKIVVNTKGTVSKNFIHYEDQANILLHIESNLRLVGVRPEHCDLVCECIRESLGLPF